MKKWLSLFLLFTMLLLLASCAYKAQSEPSFGAVTNITAEQELAVFETLEKCGINAVTQTTHDEGLDGWNSKTEKGYRITVGETKNVIVYLDNGVLTGVRYANNDIYKKSKVVAQLSDFILTYEEMLSRKSQCEDWIRETLKSPSTVKFAGTNEWLIAKDNGKIIVKSYFDAQNSFGAMMRSSFKITIKDNTVISYILDGKEMLK